ncbi:MAG: Ig-like domain-containing protein [Paludibacteraceae bacterium]|nr:Ig-like domain-containing protein [Paludibacteraceae bacterium]MBR6493213.1 Ig-like domain-containing protein [Paludibacteraceae bacterium]
MKKYLSLALVLTLVLMSCGKKTEEEMAVVELQGISLSKKSLSMEVGNKATLIVVYNPEEAAKFAPAVTWESSNSSVATVEDGKVTAKRKGKTTISAYCGKFYADCVVEVENETAPITPKLSVTPTTIDDKGQGGTYTISVTCNRAWTAECEQAWATVSPAEGDGNAEVTVTVEANTATTADAQTITFTAGTVKKTVTVNRPAYHKVYPITLDLKEKEIPAEGGKFDVKVTSEADWDYKWDDHERVHITKNSDGVSITVDINKVDLGYVKSFTKIPVVFYNDDVTDTLFIKQEKPYVSLSNNGQFDSSKGKSWTIMLYSNISWQITFNYNLSGTAKDYMSADPSTGTGDTPVTVKMKKVHSSSESKSGDGYVIIRGTGKWQGLEAYRGNHFYNSYNFDD